MTLLELLVQELPKRGGWEFIGDSVFQDYDGELRVYYNGNSFTGIYLELCDCYRESGFSHSSLPDHGIVTREQYEAALAASKHPEWNGEGLPPVGTKCEWQDKNTKAWLPVLVVYQSEWVTVIREADKIDVVEIAIENYGDEACRQFRPIRTEAERKRKEIAQQMCNLFGNGIEIDEKEGYGKAWLNVYDGIAAGKIPGVKLAD